MGISDIASKISGITLSDAPPQEQTPYKNVISVPGTIEAENFDNGGQGVAYNDVSPENQGGAYRTDESVDLVESDGRIVVGYTRPGEWLEYTVDVSEAAEYELEFTVSSLNGGGSIGIDVDGETLLSGIAVPRTDDWDSYRTFTENVTLASGEQIWRVNMESAGFNLDKIVVRPPGSTSILRSPVIENNLAIKTVAGGFHVTAGVSSAQLKVTNIQGRVIFRKSGVFTNSFIPINAGGVYFIHLTQGDKRIIQRYVACQK